MKSVLAVDDSVSMRRMLAAALRGAGYEVVESCDGADALEKMRERQFDVVLTDQNMPRMDGLELTRQLRADARYSQVPVLILTTESSPEVKQAGRAAGATGWLLKPFDPEALVATLRRVAPH